MRTIITLALIWTGALALVIFTGLTDELAASASAYTLAGVLASGVALMPLMQEISRD